MMKYYDRGFVRSLGCFSSFLSKKLLQFRGKLYSQEQNYTKEMSMVQNKNSSCYPAVRKV